MPVYLLKQFVYFNIFNVNIFLTNNVIPLFFIFLQIYLNIIYTCRIVINMQKQAISYCYTKQTEANSNELKTE